MKAVSLRFVSGLTIACGLVAAASAGLVGRDARQASASRFESPEAETAARAACASRAPFVVLDTFGFFPAANVEGPTRQEDRPHRLQHGDIVAAIVEASHPGALAYQTDPTFTVLSLAADFGGLASDIEAGRIPKPAAVVSSIVLPIDLAQVNARIDPSIRFDPSALVRRRKDLLEVVMDKRDPRNPYVEVDRQLGRLRAAGVPVFVAAGNTGPDQTINMLALSEGVFAVGALDRSGAPTVYTSAPGLVSIWSPGFVVLTEAVGGLSVSGGRSTELRGADLPEQRKIIEGLAGKKVENVLRSPPAELKSLRFMGPSRQRNRFLWSTMEPGLYRTEELMAAYGYPENSGTFARAVADGPYMHFPSDMIFRISIDGTLLFDPIGDRSEGQLQVADATSFAAPNICASELFPRRVAAASRPE